MTTDHTATDWLDETYERITEARAALLAELSAGLAALQRAHNGVEHLRDLYDIELVEGPEYGDAGRSSPTASATSAPPTPSSTRSLTTKPPELQSNLSVTRPDQPPIHLAGWPGFFVFRCLSRSRRPGGRV